MARQKLPPTPPGFAFLQHGWLSANGVLLHGERTVLIDCGHLNRIDRTLAGLRALDGRTAADVDAVWLTHPHSDHAGGTATFQRAGADVWAHPITAERVNTWDERSMWISHADQIHERFTVTRTIDAGEPVTINELTIVPYHVPGHATGMVALYCPEHRFLITADALWENGFGPLAPGIEGDTVVDQQRDSIRTLAALDVDVVIPGHGPMFTDLAAACERALGRLDAYVQEPARVARSRMRAYFVHHLLEVDGMPQAEAVEYLQRVPCYAETHAQYFGAEAPEPFWREFLADMLARGIVTGQNGRLATSDRPTPPERATGQRVR